MKGISAKIRAFVMLVIFGLASLTMPILSRGDDVEDEYHWSGKPGSCRHGLHHQPKGPFALLLFCEHALGNHIMLVYYDVLGAPISLRYGREWGLFDRVWQEPQWGSNVTSFLWSPGGTKLYVATADIYGSGALFEIDLRKRGAKQIAPTNAKVSMSTPGPGYIITGLDSDRGLLRFRVAPWNSETSQEPLEATHPISEE